MVQVTTQPGIRDTEQLEPTVSTLAQSADFIPTLLSDQAVMISLEDWVPSEENTFGKTVRIGGQRPQYVDVLVTTGQFNSAQIQHAAHQWVVYDLLQSENQASYGAPTGRYDSVTKILVRVGGEEPAVSQPQLQMFQQGYNWISLLESATDDPSQQAQPMDEPMTSVTDRLAESRSLQGKALWPAVIGGGLLGAAVLSLGLTAVFAAIGFWPLTVACLFVAITTTLLGLVELAHG